MPRTRDAQLAHLAKLRGETRRRREARDRRRETRLGEEREARDRRRVVAVRDSYRRRREAEEPEERTRVCLKCGDEFTSRWIGNRRCGPCRRDGDAGAFDNFPIEPHGSQDA